MSKEQTDDYHEQLKMNKELMWDKCFNTMIDYIIKDNLNQMYVRASVEMVLEASAHADRCIDARRKSSLT